MRVRELIELGQFLQKLIKERNVEGFLAALASAAEPVELNFLWRPQLSDPSDELMLEAAVNGQAQAIVTHNIRDFRPAAVAFGIKVITPAVLLKELKK
jgi:predicted nucleic acid-binding protein